MTDLGQRKLMIPFTSLNEGRVSFHFDWHPEDLNYPHIAGVIKTLDVDVKVSILDGGYLIKIALKGRVKLFCNRCGCEFAIDIKGSVDTFYTADSSQCNEENEGDIRLIPPKELSIDITPDAFDILILAVPTKSLCSSDCQGLCSTCGADLNKEKCSCKNEKTDSRWDAFKNISFGE